MLFRQVEIHQQDSIKMGQGAMKGKINHSLSCFFQRNQK